jgi:hypothetical protein
MQKTVQDIERMGARKRRVFVWARAASFTVTTDMIVPIARMRRVQRVLPVRRLVRPAPDRATAKRTALPCPPQPQDSTGIYAAGFSQLAMVSIPRAHAAICSTRGAAPGAGVTIACFDDGFSLSHPCFDSLHARGGIVAESTFVDSVCAADVAAGCHGSQVLSLLVGCMPGSFMGAAYGADVILAHTECGPYERHVEEDNWVAALVWAAQLGADIVSSSLAYRYGFDAPDTGYAYEDMNGNATTISRQAALYAQQHDMLIVNAMGNEGARDQGGYPTIAAPADAEGVIAVGGVTPEGRIWGLSSRGPAADGRLAPDLCAQATQVYLPGCDTMNTYLAQGRGTSFATPVVAGICALVLQCHPDASATRVRQRLYSSCSLAPYQDSVDNAYGRGIPDAVVACGFGGGVRPETSTVRWMTRQGLQVSFNNGVIRYRFVPGGDVFTAPRCRITMCDAAGRVVYTTTRSVAGPYRPVQGAIAEGISRRPGVYLVTIQYDTAMYARRVPVW